MWCLSVTANITYHPVCRQTQLLLNVNVVDYIRRAALWPHEEADGSTPFYRVEG